MWSFYKVSNCRFSAYSPIVKWSMTEQTWKTLNAPLDYYTKITKPCWKEFPVCFYLRQEENMFLVQFDQRIPSWFLMWNFVGVSRKVRVGCREAAAGSEEAIWATTSWACCLTPQPLASRPPEPPLRVVERQQPEPWSSHHTCERRWKC